jgi:hypothetical protein
MKLKATIVMLALGLALAITPVIGLAADNTKTLKGEAVDINCYLGGKSGEAHAGCAAACAAKGNPIGFVVKEGDKTDMYLVIGAGGKQAKDVVGSHMGKQITVTGKVTKKDGMNIIAIENVSES